MDPVEEKKPKPVGLGLSALLGNAKIEEDRASKGSDRGSMRGLNLKAVGSLGASLNANAGGTSNLAAMIGKKFANSVAKTAAKDVIRRKVRTELVYVRKEDIERPDKEHIKAKARYLYWACFRGDTQLVKYLLEVDAISPFYCCLDGRSPLMASLIGKHRHKLVSKKF